MDITGKIKLIRETQQISEKFQKREFVVETNEQYPQTIQLELQGNKCDIIDAYAVGQEVTCDLNLRGRLWVDADGVDKYFNTIVCWQIQPSNAPVGGNKPQAETKTNAQEFGAPLPSEDPDDLPFN